MEHGLSRRQFLKVTAAGTVLLAAGLSLESCAEETPAPLFFSAHERDLVQAAATRLLPADGDTGVVDYIERLLTAFEHNPPRIFAGGPFSGRHPYPDNKNGRPSHDFPSDEFERFVPLTRAKEIAWRTRIYGSGNVPGGNFNDSVLGPTKGYRQSYRDGLAALDAKSRELFGKSFVALAAGDQNRALAEADQGFVGLLLEHTLEGTYAAPEYGGNLKVAGWRSVTFDGDSQPLGYSIYDEATGAYHELRDRPLSSANPNEDNRGFSPATIDLLDRLSTALGGKRFS